jgi:hypothetical protein
MNPSAAQPKSLTVEEVRIVADLRIMHGKVDELYHVVGSMQQRHAEVAEIVRYADARLLTDDIRKVDEIYQWFVTLKEERDRHLSA